MSEGGILYVTLPLPSDFVIEEGQLVLDVVALPNGELIIGMNSLLDGGSGYTLFPTDTGVTADNVVEVPLPDLGAVFAFDLLLTDEGLLDVYYEDVATGETQFDSYSIAGVTPAEPIIGTDDADRFVGSQFDDMIAGGRGDDRLIGRDGDDEMFGGRGADVLRGQDGEDYINGN